MKKITCLSVIFLVIATMLVFLSTATISTKKAIADSGEWNAKPAEKAGKGITNFLLGWTEVPKKVMYDGPKEQGLASVLLSPYNCVRGIFDGFRRTVGGGGDTILSVRSGNWVDDYPLSEW
jgi:hypothetical protein